MQQHIVIGTRPTSIAAWKADRVQPGVKRESDNLPIGLDWLIFNAPRPIVGHIEWRGDFISGIFYAAVDPNGDRAGWMIQENTGLKAVVLNYVTLAEVMAWGQAYAEAEGYDWAEWAEMGERAIIASYLEAHR